MDKMKERTVLSESEEKPKQNKTEENVSDKINGNGLLELIHDTIGRITDILQGVSDEAKPKETEDVVEFKKDTDEAEDAEGGACEALPLDIAEPFEILNDDDFAKDDPVVNTFNNDMGGCGKIVKVVRISAKEALSHLTTTYKKLNDIRVANKTTDLQEVFNHINAVASGKGAKHQVLAVQKIEKLMRDATPKEKFALRKAKEAVLAGTVEHLDAAGFRVRGVLAQYAPEKMVRTAYTNLETQSGDLIMLPQGKHQLGYPTTLELSKFRDQSVDAKIDPNTGDVKNGYMDFEQRRDNMAAVTSRFETHKNPENKENLLTLAEGERSKPLTKNERNYEQRLDEDTKGRYNQKAWEKSVETALDDAKPANLGHHGEPEEDESIARTLSKTASAGYDKIDPKSDDTMGEQLSAMHSECPDDTTLEQMLEDERVGLTEEELDMLLEEWLETSRKNK